jgi:hypothetical protein
VARGRPACKWVRGMPSPSGMQVEGTPEKKAAGGGRACRRGMGIQPDAQWSGTAASELGRPSPWAFSHEIWPRALPRQWWGIRWTSARSLAMPKPSLRWPMFLHLCEAANFCRPWWSGPSARKMRASVGYTSQRRMVRRQPSVEDEQEQPPATQTAHGCS